jgi:hypothetical protein
MSVENDIQNALFARVASMVLTPAVRVVWPNMSEGSRSTYLRVWPLPNRPDRILIGSDGPHRRQGILQLSLFTPLNQGDVAKPIADQIAGHFAPDTQMASNGVTVRVTSAPFIRNGRPETAHWHTPIEIPYESFS